MNWRLVLLPLHRIFPSRCLFAKVIGIATRCHSIVIARTQHQITIDVDALALVHDVVASPYIGKTPLHVTHVAFAPFNASGFPLSKYVEPGAMTYPPVVVLSRSRTAALSMAGSAISLRGRRHVSAFEPAPYHLAPGNRFISVIPGKASAVYFRGSRTPTSFRGRSCFAIKTVLSFSLSMILNSLSGTMNLTQSRIRCNRSTSFCVVEMKLS